MREKNQNNWNIVKKILLFKNKQISSAKWYQKMKPNWRVINWKKREFVTKTERMGEKKRKLHSFQTAIHIVEFVSSVEFYFSLKIFQSMCIFKCDSSI